MQADRKRKSRGRQGEDLACSFLKKKGYRILERNFRCKMGEVDIIALGEGSVVFAEVKARTRTDYGMPRDAVDYRKRFKLIKTAKLWMKLHPELARDYSPRMDIVEILYLPGGTFVRHTLNAFSE